MFSRNSMGTTLREGIAAFRLLPYISRHDKKVLKEVAKVAAEGKRRIRVR